MKLNYFISLCFLILQLSQAKESKMKNLLKEAEQIKSAESTNTNKISKDDASLLYHGWHRGRIMSYNNFEYKGQHGWMTSKEAVKKCDIDPACGGFTFFGFDVEDQKHYIFFVTYIPFNGIRKREIVIDNLLWNTYRSIKKVIRIPGKPHILHHKNVVTDPDVIKTVQKSIEQNQPLENWPLNKYVSLIYDNGIVYGHNDMIYKDQNFNAASAVTFIRNEKVALPEAQIIDGSTFEYNFRCKNYSKPLQDTNLRFDSESEDNILVRACNTISREDFDKNFIQTKTPVKLKGCFNSEKLKTQEKIPKGLWQSVVKTNPDNDAKAKSFELSNFELQKFSNQNLAIKASMVKKFSILDEFLLYPKLNDLINTTSKVKFNSENTGNIKEKYILDQLYFQQRGKSWLISVPQVTTNYACTFSDKTLSENLIYEASSWFNHFQPQLKFEKVSNPY